MRGRISLATFLHLKTNEPLKDRALSLTAIHADTINLRLAKMADGREIISCNAEINKLPRTSLYSAGGKSPHIARVSGASRFPHGSAANDSTYGLAAIQPGSVNGKSWIEV
jgi:hypothetical protein